MTSRSIPLVKSFLHGIKRQQSYAAINTSILGRRWMSDSTALENPLEELKTKLITPRKKPGRPPKVATDPDAPPPRRRGKAASKPKDPEIVTSKDGSPKAEQEQTGEETPKKRRRRKVDDDSGNTKPKRPKKPSKVALDPFDGLSSPMELQPLDMWTSYYPYKREWVFRTMIANPETARRYAEALVPPDSKDKIIIEANPGAGQLSRALLRLPKSRIKKLILLEDAPLFMSTLKPLETVDPRVVVVQASASQWSTYLDMETNGVLDEVDTIPWEEENRQLQFVMSVPAGVHGDQLVSQFLRAIPERQWLFKYGRMPMNLLMTTRMWERVCSPVHSQPRCKVSAIAETVSDFSELLPSSDLLPHWEHFYPTRWGQPQTLQMAACNIVPKAHQLITPGDLEVWDYCMRKMFVLRATPISGALYTLGAGGANLLAKLTDPSLPEDQRLDPSKTTRDLNAHDWSLIVNAFKAWPFRPADLSMENHLTRNLLA